MRVCYVYFFISPILCCFTTKLYLLYLVNTLVYLVSYVCGAHAFSKYVGTIIDKHKTNKINIKPGVFMTFSTHNNTLLGQLACSCQLKTNTIV